MSKEVMRVAVKGGEIEIDVAGPADRRSPLVLFLHGWTLDRRMWAAQLSALSPRYFLAAPDRRGFGRSSAPPDLQWEHEDVLQIADALGADKVVLVGMSQAGRVAADFALRRPERTAGLVFHGARLGRVAAAAAPDIPVADYAALARAGALSEMKRRWRAHPLMKGFGDDADRLIDAMLGDYQGRDLSSPSVAAPDPGDDALRTITAPALCLAGARDSDLRRRVASHLGRLLPRGRHIEIENAGHLCNVCAAAAYNQALTVFLSSL